MPLIKLEQKSIVKGEIFISPFSYFLDKIR
nr:MAG TPA: hypothetical protein [Caudoviricetes sp.]